MNWKENLARSGEVLGAMWRQGAKELGNVLYGAGTAAAPAEYGMPMTKLPSEIAQDMHGEQTNQPARDDHAPSILDRYTQPAASPNVGMDRANGERGLGVQPEPLVTHADAERNAVELERD